MKLGPITLRRHHQGSCWLWKAIEIIENDERDQPVRDAVQAQGNHEGIDREFGQSFLRKAAYKVRNI